jgi:SAM-dependent methyltransferase
MTAHGSDKVFGSSMAEVYERYLVPLIFLPYAADLSKRVSTSPGENVLEIAAGTGAVTRELARRLPPDIAIVATDLNQGMLNQAAGRGTSRPVTFRLADAMALPFPDGSVDTIVCQFGTMFFPDKCAAFAEARRVLRPGGHFHFNVWDRIEENEFADVVTEALAEIFPTDPPRFMARIPHGYHDIPTIRNDLAAGGFTGNAEIETVRHVSRADSFEDPSIAYCQGTPLRTEIEKRGGKLDEATAHAAKAIAQKYGLGPVEGRIQAHVISVIT